MATAVLVAKVKDQISQCQNSVIIIIEITAPSPISCIFLSLNQGISTTADWNYPCLCAQLALNIAVVALAASGPIDQD